MNARWPSFLVKPKLNLSRPTLKMPSRPSDTLIFGSIMLFVIFVLGGGVYTLVRDPIAIGQYLNKPALLAYGLDSQFKIEGFVASGILLIGILGFGLLYRATRYTYQPAFATRILLLGLLLAGLSYLILQYFIIVKSTVPS